MKVSQRMLKPLTIVAICLLAMLLVPLVVGAAGVRPDGQLESQDDTYPWPEPVAIRPLDVSLLAGPYASWTGAASDKSRVTGISASGKYTASIGVLALELKDQLSTPTSVSARGYCADLNQSALENLWLPYCRETSSEVTYILANYYPNTAAPVTGGGTPLSLAEKAAAVQSAIWHFTDGMVLFDGDHTSHPVYLATQAIIADANVNGGGSTPIAADLQLTPKTERNDLNDSTTHTVTAKLTDGSGTGVSGQNVRFQVTRKGVVVEDEVRTTNASGEAEFTYTGPATIGDEVITDSIYATVNYQLAVGLRFCDDDKQDYVLVDPKVIPLEDSAVKEWVQCVDYTVVNTDYDVDCVEEETTYSYLVSGKDEPGANLQTWALGLCNLTGVGHDVVRVEASDVYSCLTGSPGPWTSVPFVVKAPDPTNLIPGQWSVEIPSDIGPGECQQFRIVIDGLWEYTTVPWAQKSGLVCAQDGSILGPSCEPYGKPDCTITAPDAVCDGATNQLASTTSGYTAYSWTVISGTLVSGQGTDSIIWSATPGEDSVLLKVTVTDELGCSSSCEKRVTVTPLPVVRLDDEEVCVDENVTLTAIMLYTGDCELADITYTWYMSNTVTGQWDLLPGETGATLTRQMTVVGEFIYRVEACCGTCCHYNDGKVTVHPYPVVTMQGDEVCLNEPVTLLANVTDPGACASSDLMYTWYAVVNTVRVLLPEGGPSLSVDTSVAGTQTFVVEVCCEDCCVEEQATVVVHPYPQVRLMPQEVCEDEVLDLNAVIDSYGDCDPNEVVISWYMKDSFGQWSLLTGEVLPTLSVDTSTAGDYEYKVRVCCGDCCDEAETTVTVHPYPAITLVGDEICLGEDATLTANVTDSGDCEPGDLVLSWYISNTATLTWDLLPGETGTTLQTTPTAAGTYNYRVQVCCDDCCATADAQLIVHPLPVVVLTGDEVCLGSTATVTSDIQSPGDCEPAELDITWSAWNDTTLQWDVLAGETGETLSVTPTAVGSYLYKMTVCCDDCCDEAEATVVVYPEPTCWIEGETGGCAGDTITFTAAPGGVTYAWSVDGVLEVTGPSSSFDWVAVAGSHVISVLITDENGCQSECSLPVTPSQPRLIVRKWHDLNEDGQRGQDETPLGGWAFTVYDELGIEVASGVSDDVKGEVDMGLLDCGTYTVTETMLPFWRNTTPLTQTITIDVSQEVWVVEFGNVRVGGLPLAIFGIKFWDLDHNGRNDSEPRLEGFHILIHDSADNLVADLTTDAGGSWSYDITTADIYTIQEVVPSGWAQTYPVPNGGVYKIEVYSEASVLKWRLLSAEPIDWDDSFDFGNTRPMGFKWHDFSQNGYVDPGEPLLGNWRIVMKDMAFNIVHDTRTVAGHTSPYFGYWFLTRPLPEGEYYVVEEPLSNWVQSYPGDGGYKIYLYADGSYDVLSAPLPWRDGLSFGNWQRIEASCPLCINKVVFQSDRAAANYNIFTMDMDGNGVLQLTDNMAADVSPAWHFGQQYITFASNRDGDWEVYRMDNDGTDQINVTNMPGSTDVQPNWNCDWITFQTDRDGNWEIYKVDPLGDTTVQIRLTENDAADVAPYWSPDESKIAFQSNRDGNWEIYVMSAEGEAFGLQRITDDLAIDRNPAWLLTAEEAENLRLGLPGVNSKWIVFESDRDHAGQFDLYKVHIDTGELVQLTTDAASDMDPAGAPYCDYIVFESARDGRSSDVWRMRHDGTEQTNITLGDIGPTYWFDAIDQMLVTITIGWDDPGVQSYRSVVPLILTD